MSAREREKRHPPSCGSISGHTGRGCKLSSLPLWRIHPFCYTSIHLCIHPFISKGVTGGDKTQQNGTYVCLCMRESSACVRVRLVCLWICWHEELKQNRQKDENAPVSQPQHPLLGSGDHLHNPVTGRLRDLLQHPGRRPPYLPHALCPVIIAKITWMQQMHLRTGDLKQIICCSSNPFLFIGILAVYNKDDLNALFS